MTIVAMRRPTARLSTKVKLFRGFGDRSRLAIVETLLEGPISVGAIVARTGLSQPLVSMHLACMRC